MPTAAFETLGCKVNQYETDAIARRMREAGFRIVSSREPADVYVINTCSVTSVAEAKSRKTVRRLARLNPSALVVVTGCDVEMAARVGRSLPEATLIVPNARKMDLVEEVLAASPALASALRHAEPGSDAVQPRQQGTPSGRTRATVKVQDGCDMFCSFCSVPYTRGAVRSRPLPEVLDEVRRLVAEGFKEIVVTGILVGSYGRDGLGPGLAELMTEVANVPGVRRVRLSSIEPTHVTVQLLEAMAANPRICPHLHLPLQSGDDAVLAAMNRPYTASDYLEICRRAASMLPGLAVTSDVLVGFPGETEAAHRNTLDVLREVGIARVHVFRYSRRPGTPAANSPDQVPEETKARRAREVAALGAELRRSFAERHLGTVQEVLAEPTGLRGHLAGYTPNYIRVVFREADWKAGDIVPVRLIRCAGDDVLAEPARDAAALSKDL